MKKLSKHDKIHISSAVVIVLLALWLFSEINARNEWVRTLARRVRFLEIRLVDEGIDIFRDGSYFKQPASVEKKSDVVNTPTATQENKKTEDVVQPERTITNDEVFDFINGFESTERAFDPAILHYYHPTAQLIVHRGDRTLTLPIDEYKQLLLAGLPVAESLNDTNDYTVVSIFETDGEVTLETKKFNQRTSKNTTHTFTLIKVPNGDIKIIKEEG